MTTITQERFSDISLIKCSLGADKIALAIVYIDTWCFISQKQKSSLLRRM